MRKKLKIPRILKIQKVDGLVLTCIFNNGESRVINFKELFDEWNISEKDAEFALHDKEEFAKVQLRNNTLSWENIPVMLLTENGTEQVYPYEIDPLVLYQKSKAIEQDENMKFGTMIRRARRQAGLTQEQLAMRSGTSRFYISRVENNKTDIELSTFRKIVEAGLGKELKLVIE